MRCKVTVRDRRKHNVNASRRTNRDMRRVFAADDDELEGFGTYEDDDDDLYDTLDDVADTVEDIQDTVDEVEEDDVSIEIDNNIDDHYIAECDSCKGVFISATILSDQRVDKVSGICPLCNKETDQMLKWVVKAIDEADNSIQ